MYSICNIINVSNRLYVSNINNINEAFDLMKTGRTAGRIIIDFL